MPRCVHAQPLSALYRDALLLSLAAVLLLTALAAGFFVALVPSFEVRVSRLCFSASIRSMTCVFCTWGAMEVISLPSTFIAPQVQKTQVIDLMEALKQS